MILARHTTPDGTLTLIVEQLGDDVQIGFEGMAWHTHGGIIAQQSGLAIEAAAERFVQDLLQSHHMIALLRREGILADAWVTDDPRKDAKYAEPGEIFEFRYWDGSIIQPQPDPS